MTLGSFVVTIDLVNDTSNRFWWSRLVVIVVLISTFLFLGKFFFNQYRDQLVSEKRIQLENNLNLIGDSTSQLIKRRLTLLTGLEKFVMDSSDNKIAADFNIFAKGLHNDTEGVRNIGIAPGGILKYIYPIKGNEAAFGYDLLADQTPSVRSDVTRTIGVKQVIVSDPFELRQKGLGVAARKAIFKSGKLWGLISMVIDVPSVTSRLENVNSIKGYSIALRDKTGKVFWGSQSVFGNNPVIVRVDTGDGFWELGGIPSLGWDKSIAGSLGAFLAAELFFVSMVIVVFALLWFRIEKVVNFKLSWSTRAEALRPATWYLALSVVWILFSDELIGILVKDPETLVRASIIKGWLFVVVTTSLLYIWTVQSFEKFESLLSFLRRIQNVARLGYYVLDIRTGYWEGSDVLRKIFGIDEKYKTDITGWLDIVHPDQRKEMSEYFANEVVNNKRQFDKDYKIINKTNGKEIWVHGMGSLEFDVKGNPIRMIGTIQDISEMKMKEIDIGESEEKFKYLFDFMGQGAILQDSDGEILEVNMAAAKILGVPREQFIGKKIEDYDWKMITERGSELDSKNLPMWVVMNSGKPVNGVVVGIYLPHFQDSLKWIEMSSVPRFRKGLFKPYLILTTFSDITDRKKMEDKLAKARTDVELEKQELETVLKDMGDAVFAVDTTGVIRLVNHAALEMTGFFETDLVGKKCKEKIKILSEKTNKEAECIVDTVLNNRVGSESSEPLLLAGNNGKTLAVNLVATPVKDMSGMITGVVVVMRDESKQRALNKARADFVSVASHQLRAPLTGIKWFVELLHENLSKVPMEKTEEYINKIGESNQRLIDLVNDLLLTSKIEENELGLVDLKSCSVKNIIQEAIVLQGRLFVDKGVRLEGVENIPDEYMVEVNKVQMMQVFENILNNSVSYSPANSRIDVWAEKHENSIWVMIKDEGIGIPESQKSKVFDKYFRADNVISHSQGSGLGLYVSKNIIEKHGGKIWFESVENQGTTFFVELLIKQKKRWRIKRR